MEATAAPKILNIENNSNLLSWNMWHSDTVSI